VLPGIHRKRAAVEPVRERLAVHRHLHGDHVRARGVLHFEGDRRLGVFEVIEPLRAVAAYDDRTRGVGARAKLLARLRQLAVGAQVLPLPVGVDALILRHLRRRGG
jgi:hypothetical protein